MIDKNKDYKLEILKILRSNQLSTREISQELGVTYGTTLKYLEILNASLMVENKVFGKTKVWTLKKINPLELDENTLFYNLIKKCLQELHNFDFLINLLDSFYTKSLESINGDFQDLTRIETLKKYLEILKNSKWKEISDYKVFEENKKIYIEIPECKYKFGCCYNLKKEDAPIFCIEGYRFVNLLNKETNQKHILELLDISISPNYCKISIE